MHAQNPEISRFGRKPPATPPLLAAQKCACFFGELEKGAQKRAHFLGEPEKGPQKRARSLGKPEEGPQKRADS